MNADQIYAEIARVERQINWPDFDGKRTTLKAYHRKLCRAYMKARSGE